MDVFVGLLLRANTQFRLQHLSRYTNANKKTLLIKITAYLLVLLHIIKLGFGRKEITHHVNRNSSLVSKTANKLSKSWVTSFPVISLYSYRINTFHRRLIQMQRLWRLHRSILTETYNTSEPVKVIYNTRIIKTWRWCFYTENVWYVNHFVYW